MNVTVREVAYDELAPIVAERQGRYMEPDPPRVWFAAFDGDVIVGCCAVQRIDGHPGIATFRNDYVREAHRRRGIYRALCAARVAWCRRVGILVVVTRCTADSLPSYLRWGFSVPPDWLALTPVVAEVSRLEEPTR
jgi:GNAT superfamily N-acetyltransferase